MAEQLNSDMTAAIANALEAAGKLADLDLTGEVMAYYGDLHVGYISFNGETEATFSQVPKS